MSGSVKVIIALLTLIAVFLGLLVVDHLRPSVSAAPVGGGGGVAGNLIALTGNNRGNGESVLYVIDAGRETVVAYQLYADGELYPVSIRSIAADLQAGPILLDSKLEGQITRIRPGTKGFSPRQLRDDLENIKAKKGTP